MPNFNLSLESEDVCALAQELLGKELLVYSPQGLCSGIICETEAYAGASDKASHAWNNRRTPRTETMFGPPGTAYVYLCYGMHWLFNIVTGPREVPHAVLIRAIRPKQGWELMEMRRNKKATDPEFSNGPAKLTKALGIGRDLNGKPMHPNSWFLKEGDFRPTKVRCGPRIGIDYADEAKDYPYRFWIEKGET
jgi:DNA-3-methyladenine glycosylase